jgi:hypothetical protein
LAHPTLKASMRGTDAAVGAAFYLEQNRCLPPDVHPPSSRLQTLNLPSVWKSD